MAAAVVSAALVGCSTARAPVVREAGIDARADVLHDASHPRTDGAPGPVYDAGVDVRTAFDTGPVVTPLASPRLRLANWSPDAPGVDLCLAPRGTSSFTGPLLAGALGAGLLGDLEVVPVGARFDAGLDGSGVRDAGRAPDGAREPEAGGGQVGVPFPRVSPYVSVAPGAYTVRVVRAGVADCESPLFADTDDLAALVGGVTETLALVGDVAVQGTDPGVRLAVLPDDTSVPAPGGIGLRFVNAVPSVTEVSFVSGSVVSGTVMPYLAAAQFGGAGVDTDAGVLDRNDYLALPALTGAVWSLVNANGGVATLANVENVTVAAGGITTVVGVGGKSGPFHADVGILLCVDRAPLGTSASPACVLYAASKEVCPLCP